MTIYDSYPVPGTYKSAEISGVEILASMTGLDQRTVLFKHVADTIWPIGAVVKVGQDSPRRYTAMSIADLSNPVELAKFAGVLRFALDVSPASPDEGTIVIGGTLNSTVINCQGTLLTAQQIQLLPGKYFSMNGYWKL